MFTCASGQLKAVTVQNSSLTNGANVVQYAYNGSTSSQWLLEPTGNYKPAFGANYAHLQYNHRISTYPNLDGYSSLQNSTNFVSQCLTAGGYHYTNEWLSKKKNSIYLSPTNSSQLNNSWEFNSYSDPTNNPVPWINPVDFENYWSGTIIRKTYNMSNITGNPPSGSIFVVSTGDVVQFKKPSFTGYKSFFSMYVADESDDPITVNNLGDVLVTYHQYNDTQTIQNNQGLELYWVCYSPPFSNGNYKVEFFDFFED